MATIAYQRADGKNTKRGLRMGRLYLEGYTPGQIAAAMGVDQRTVTSYLKRLNAEWRRDDPADYAARLADETARLRRIELEANKAWRRSQGGVVVERRKYEPVAAPALDPTLDIFADPFADVPEPPRMVVVEETVETRHQCGDPRYLELAKACVVERLKLMGAYRDDLSAAGMITAEQVVSLLKAVVRAAEAEITDEAAVQRLRERTLRLLPQTAEQLDAGAEPEANGQPAPESEPPPFEAV